MSYTLNLKGSYVIGSTNAFDSLWMDKINNRLWTCGSIAAWGADNLKVFSFDGSTFTLLAQEYNYMPNFPVYGPVGDGAYVYTVNSDILRAWTYSAGVITQAGSISVTISGGTPQLTVDSQGYVYISSSAHGTIYGYYFDGTTFLLKKTASPGATFKTIVNGNRVFVGGGRGGGAPVLRAYSFNGISFIENGSVNFNVWDYIYGMVWNGTSLITSNSNSNGVAGYRLRYFDYNGSTFTEVGTGINPTGYGSLAFDGTYYYLHNDTSGGDYLNVYLWDGSTFVLQTNILILSGGNITVQAITTSGPSNGGYVFFAGSTTLYAYRMELTSQFTADNTTGPAPLTVNFTSA